ncbi:N-acetylgalactosaminyltransferase 6-like [Leguminivora glycinivorella]|uniref:N-acetylgalactosaminyltransferase 6-like n=1 Tax=Leguminivora glycinivorella TaxID=1035111 RepID=UPI00200E8F2A|nr:N-acetylgalactosaminyltransferase 6-like [Leguminivora glycinivorella]
MRRYVHRLLRLRNLLILVLILIVLYTLRSWPDTIEREPPVVVPELSALSGTKIPVFVPKSMKKIDWHNYIQIVQDEKRTGIGEHGLAASLPSSEASLEESLYAVNGFNGALSDKIPLNRSLRDIRHSGCKSRLYIESLPTVSVVVPFHNEHWSTLLRTAQSVVNRSPPQLLREVLLVDDASTKDFLKSKLDEYLAANIPKARVIRLEKRSGLITARLAGARQATSDVLVFLDSHTEANVNWLPPLLEPIALDYRTAVCPFIDVVDYATFEYRPQDEGARGAFDWELFYKRLPVLPRDEERMPEPFPSPVMAGGLFAISRAWFWQLGGYDPGLDIWGGEQYELSFKIWQCGGRMLDAPCSRVGHIYRKFAPFPNPNHGDFVGKNYRRVAEVWMDEYAEYLYQRRPHYRLIDTGDISEQQAIRQKLKCKSFRWFMTQVAFDLIAKYPPVEPKAFAHGRIRPAEALDLCADAYNGNSKDSLLLKPCQKGLTEQNWEFTWHKDIKVKNRRTCWDLPDASLNSPVRLYDCHLGGGNQEWRYDPKTHQIRKSERVCLDSSASDQLLFVSHCDTDSPSQRFKIDHVDLDALSKWDSLHLAVTGPEVPDWYVD